MVNKKIWIFAAVIGMIYILAIAAVLLFVYKRQSEKAAPAAEPVKSETPAAGTIELNPPEISDKDAAPLTETEKEPYQDGPLVM